MGNHQSKNTSDIQYLTNMRKDPIHYKINDDFPYPRRPKPMEVNQQFTEILKSCILTVEQNQEIPLLKDEIKWKLICKHRYFLLTAKHLKPNEGQKTKAEAFVESLKASDSISEIDKLLEWLSQEAKENNINDFLIHGGLYMLINVLIRAETCSRATQNYNKQLIVLKILSFLTTFQQTINALIQIPKAINAIFLNFNKTQLGLNKYVLQILTNISWNSKEGPKLVSEALSFYKSEFGYKLRFEPFINILEEAKNVVLIEMTVMFINTLIESPSQEDKREAIRSEFTMCELKNIYKEIKEKIKGNKYKIEDSVYNARRGSKEMKMLADPFSLVLLDEKEQFDEKMTSILRQIEIFENRFQQYIEEKEEECESSNDSKEEEINQIQRKENKKKTVDFSDINEIFAKIVGKTLSNENYENFFKILQQLCLIPSNEQGTKVWNILNKSLQDITGIKQDKVLKLEQLETLIENSECKEDLEQKLSYMDTQLRVRDDEIKNLKKGKLNMEIQLKGSEKKAESYGKELNKQIEAYKLLEFQLNDIKHNKKSPETTIKKAELNTLKNQNSIKNVINDGKVSGSLEKKQGNKSFYANESETNKKSDQKVIDITKSEEFQEKLNNLTEKQSTEFEEKIKGLNKKIAELERFINNGIDEGFSSTQYIKLQSNLTNLGFSPLKEQFKTVKKETEIETPLENQNDSKESATKKDNINNPLSNFKKKKTTAKEDLIFDTENERLNYQKNNSFSMNINHSNCSNKEINKSKETNVEITFETKTTLQIINPLPKLDLEENKSYESPIEKKSNESSKETKENKSNESTNETKENKSNESPKEKKPDEIKSLSPTPSPLLNSESISPNNFPMNMPPPPPPPPPLFGLKPGMPPGINLLNLLNKKPAGSIKEKKKPNVPMKQILWTLVNPLNVKGTIWETIDETTVSYEIPHLETEFTSVRADKTVIVSKIPSKISLLSPNRTQNINIVLSRLKMSPASIAEAILSVNEELLNLNVVNCLLDAIPNTDEISLISNYVGDMNMLENPEKFILEIKDIKNLKTRLQAMQFYFTHKELFEDLQLKIKKVLELFENISKEQRIIILMKYTLAIGNYMNGESARGGAFGFKLDVFEKIVDIKNINGKKNLLAYIIEIIENNIGRSYIEINEEFPLYEFGRKLPISQLFSDLDYIKKGIEYVRVAKQNKNAGVVDNIQEVLEKFEGEVKDKFQDIEFELGCLDQKYKRVCEFYCEDPKQMSSDIFVENFYKIWTACKKAKVILIKENKELSKVQPKEKKVENRKSNVGNMFNNPEELANTITHLRISRGSIVGKAMKFERK